MKEFGKKAYTHTVYINFEDNVTMEDLFSYDLDTKRLITGMELYSGKKLILITHSLYLMNYRNYLEP